MIFTIIVQCACVCVCFFFQDFPCTNAGIGSNLTKSGTVECDASIMDGQSLTFGAVGALKGVRNPIQVASKVLEEEMKGSSTLGLIPPMRRSISMGNGTWFNHMS